MRVRLRVEVQSVHEIRSDAGGRGKDGEVNTLLAIHSYKSAADRVKRLHPYWNVGWDILGVNTDGGEHEWPEGIRTVSIGREDGWNNAVDLAVGYLPIRLLDTIRFFLMDDGCKAYTHLFLMHQDCVFPRKPPLMEIRFLATFAGVCPKEWNVSAKNFLHVPWWMDRDVAAKILVEGDKLVQAGEFENSSDDVFIGRIIDLLGIEVQTSNTWSCNSNDMRVRWMEACAAVASGAWFIHGLREPEQIDLVMK